MAYLALAAASLEALSRHLGPVQPAGAEPMWVRVAAGDVDGDGRADMFWVSTRYGFATGGLDEIVRSAAGGGRTAFYRILPYIEQDNLYRLGFEYVRVGPSAAIRPARLPLGWNPGKVPRTAMLIADGTSNTIMVSEHYSLGFERTFLGGDAGIALQLGGARTGNVVQGNFIGTELAARGPRR